MDKSIRYIFIIWQSVRLIELTLKSLQLQNLETWIHPKTQTMFWKIKFL